MQILVISDTHGSRGRMEELLENVELRKSDWLIHCGDIGQDADWLRNAFPRAVSIVAGNCDFGADLPRETVVEREGRKFLITHGNRYVAGGMGYFLYRAKELECDVVLFGHTHVPLIEEEEGILFVNPGSLALPRQSDGRPTYAVIRVENGTATAEIRSL